MTILEMCVGQPEARDRYLSADLFTYLEAPHVSMGFPPLELLYGPLVYRELQYKEQEDDIMTTYTRGCSTSGKS